MHFFTVKIVRLSNKYSKTVSAIKIILSILLAVFTLTRTYSQTLNFKIAGQVSGFQDSSIIYLDGLDSTYILNGKFNFSGTINTTEKLVVLHTKGYADYKMFWIENSLHQFNAEKGNFRNAKISGSRIQHVLDSLNEQIKIFGDERNQYVNFVKNNPSSILSAYLLEVYATTWGRDTTKQLFEKLDLHIQNTTYGVSISKFIKTNKNVKIGDRYTDFMQPNPKNKMVKLSDFKDKVVLLEFWGSWCVPCRKGHPQLIKIYNKYRKSGFEILGVAADSDRKKWLAAIKEDKLPWKNISDLKGQKNEASIIYGISQYPTNYLIKDGIIIAVDLRGEILDKKLSEILK